jgi:hypothetical protein
VDPKSPAEKVSDLELRPIVLGEFHPENTLFQFETMIGATGEGVIEHTEQIRLRHVATEMFVHFHGDVTNVCNHVRFFFKEFLPICLVTALDSTVRKWTFFLNYLLSFFQKNEEDVLSFIEAKADEINSMDLIRGVAPSLVLYASKVFYLFINSLKLILPIEPRNTLPLQRWWMRTWFFLKLCSLCVYWGLFFGNQFSEPGGPSKSFVLQIKKALEALIFFVLLNQPTRPHTDPLTYDGETSFFCLLIR